MNYDKFATPFPSLVGWHWYYVHARFASIKFKNQVEGVASEVIGQVHSFL